MSSNSTIYKILKRRITLNPKITVVQMKASKTKMQRELISKIKIVIFINKTIKLIKKHLKKRKMQKNKMIQRKKEMQKIKMIQRKRTWQRKKVR